MVFQSLTALMRARSGAMAPLLAIALLGLAPVAAITVDAVQAWTAKNNLQDGLDAALLAVARANPKTPSEMDDIARHFITANLADRHGGTIIALKVTRVADGEYTGEVTIRVPTFFGGLLGANNMQAGVNSHVKVGKSNVEVVLALDTTGSMAGSRINALRDAAKDFVKEMVKEPDTRVGIVPFARHVNIGMRNRNAPGFDIPADSRTCRMETVPVHSNYRNCVQIHHNSTCWNDGTPYPCPWTENRCDYDTTWVEEERCHDLEWRGCVSLRHTPLHKDDDASSNKISGIMNASCGQELQPLTDKQGPLISTIASMNVGDETFLPGGLSMGWAVLSHRLPFVEGVDPAASADTMRAIVLMTDGVNTVSKNPTEIGHWGNNGAEANTMTQEVCDAIKADNVLVFTVGFEVTDAAAIALLRNCATAPNFAYDAKNPAALKKAFADIGATLSRLRLAE